MFQRVSLGIARVQQRRETADLWLSIVLARLDRATTAEQLFDI
jgi:hypothetical protein